jgi:hypothetical protein
MCFLYQEQEELRVGSLDNEPSPLDLVCGPLGVPLEGRFALHINSRLARPVVGSTLLRQRDKNGLRTAWSTVNTMAKVAGMSGVLSGNLPA